MPKASHTSAEKELYKPTKDYLVDDFVQKFGHCYLEVTANGVFSSLLKKVIRHDIIFSFLKKASPDLTGFIRSKKAEWV